MKMRSLTLGASVVAILAASCALTYSPGDYTGGENIVFVDATAPTDATGAGDVVVPGVPEGGPPKPALHVLVVAGERDGADTASSDVWIAAIDDAGEIGPFAYLPSGPVRGPRSAATIADGRLLVATKTNADRVVESAPFDGGVTQDALALAWQTSVVANPARAGFGQFFAGPTFVAAGGTTTKDVDDGTGTITTVTTFETSIHVSTPDAGVYPKALTTSTSKLLVGLRDITFVTYKSLVFFWGDGASAAQRSKLYIAKTDPVNGATSIVDGPAIIDPQTAKPHTPATPIACAGEGRLFIAGGNSDVVLSASIDELNGRLGSWQAGPKLPAVLKGAGCAAWKGALHLLGGTTGTTRSDKILSSSINADGTMAPWVISPRTLLSPRSNVFALTY